MATHAERRALPYTPDQMYALVVDIERYPEFLPWCRAARITRRDGDVLYADLVIGFRMFRERFSSKVSLNPPHGIHVDYIKGPMRHLNNHWRFEPREDGCLIDFHVDFELRSAILDRAIGLLFHEAARRMVSAFEMRARAIYGSPSSPSK
jgi:coenzyme Q-binding protein COQ10